MKDFAFNTTNKPMATQDNTKLCNRFSLYPEPTYQERIESLRMWLLGGFTAIPVAIAILYGLSYSQSKTLQIMLTLI
jgi:hypothetical protein